MELYCKNSSAKTRPTDSTGDKCLENRKWAERRELVEKGRELGVE